MCTKQVPGYVAGVTNPMFQQHDSWWDLLCILDLPNSTGHIYSAEERRRDGDSGKSGAGRVTPPPPSASGGKSNKSATPTVAFDEMPQYSSDQKFVKGVISGIALLISEDWVRQQFHDHCGNIVALALDQEQNVAQNTGKMSPKSRKFVDANAQRVAAIRRSPEFAEMPAHPWVWCSDGDLREIEQALLAGTPLASEPPSPARPSVNSNKGRPPRAKSGGDAPTGDSIAEISPPPKVHPPVRSSSPSVDISAHGDSLPPTPASAARDRSERSEVVTVNNPARAYRSVWLNLRSFVRKLQLQLHLNSIDETQMYYQHFDLYLRTECTLQALLALMPQWRGGLLPVAQGLYHKSPMVRMSAMHVLQRVQQFPSTRGAYTALESYIHSAYERVCEKEADGSLQAEIVEFSRSSRGLPEMDDVGSPLGTDTTSIDGGEALVDAAAGALNSLMQGTIALMGGEESAYDNGFSETIDELDMLR
jgi:hypothetical protein